MLSEREEKGLQIAALAKIHRNNVGWWVPSQSGNGKYLVVTDRELPFCTCPDYEARQERCKHIYAVEYVIQRETKPDGSTIYTESVRFTYTQDWPAYNLAQRDEKREFMRLLHSLCQTIPQPPQTKGRPRMLLSEMAFSAVLKVYSTVSGRRFMGDLDTAYEKGYLTCKPHYNSVFNYMESPGLTPILQQLIELSATPLKSVETAFAVDSTGFSTSRFDRWFDAKYGREKVSKRWLKAHAMVGVKTNVITAIEVTPSNVGDAPMFAALVESTAQRFPVAEVSADKAYSSKRNLSVVAAVGAVPYIPFKVYSNGNQGHHKIDNLWSQMFHYYQLNRHAFLEHYHKRSNVESTFSMIKAKFGDALRSKGETGQVNELLAKALSHNVCVLIQSMYELGINPTFWAEIPLAQKVCEN